MPGNGLSNRRLWHGHDNLLAACSRLTTTAQPVRDFADLLTGRHGPDLDAWITTVEADDLPGLHTFVDILRMDLPAVVAGLTLPYSNGPMEGANAKVKFLKRQMHGEPDSRFFDNRSCSHGHSPLPPSSRQSPLIRQSRDAEAPASGRFVSRRVVLVGVGGTGRGGGGRRGGWLGRCGRWRWSGGARRG